MSNLATKARHLYRCYHMRTLPREKLLLEEAIVAAAKRGLNTLSYPVSDPFIGSELRKWLVIDQGFDATHYPDEGLLSVHWTGLV